MAEVLAVDLIDMGKNDPGKAHLALREISRTESKWPSTATVVKKIKEMTPLPMHDTRALPEPSEPWSERRKKGEQLIKQAYAKIKIEPPEQRQEKKKKTETEVKKLERHMQSEYGTMVISDEKLKKEQEDFVKRVSPEKRGHVN